MTDTLATTTVAGGDAASPVGEARSLGADARRALFRNPVFWISVIMIAVFVLMAFWPSLFTSTDPNQAILQQSRERPNADAWFGRDIQGYDIYSRVIYGARASILVGILTTLFTTSLGAFLGITAAYFGGWIDALVSRVTDMVFAIPLLLGAILFMSAFPSQGDPYFVVILKVVIAISILGWPSLARLMRSSVLQ